MLGACHYPPQPLISVPACSLPRAHSTRRFRRHLQMGITASKLVTVTRSEGAVRAPGEPSRFTALSGPWLLCGCSIARRRQSRRRERGKSLSQPLSNSFAGVTIPKWRNRSFLWVAVDDLGEFRAQSFDGIPDQNIGANFHRNRPLSVLP